jgi:UrcA family protein
MGTKLHTSPNFTGTNRTAAALALVAMVFGGAAFLPAASAETGPEARSAAERVAYADLDLSTRHGAGQLLVRIEGAARRACGTEPTHSPLFPRASAEFRTCVSDAVDTAVQRIGSPTLTAMANPGAAVGELAAR